MWTANGPKIKSTDSENGFSPFRVVGTCNPINYSKNFIEFCINCMYRPPSRSPPPFIYHWEDLTLQRKWPKCEVNFVSGKASQFSSHAAAGDLNHTGPTPPHRLAVWRCDVKPPECFGPIYGLPRSGGFLPKIQELFLPKIQELYLPEIQELWSIEMTWLYNWFYPKHWDWTCKYQVKTICLPKT